MIKNDSVDEIIEHIIEIRRRVHEYPELSMNEFRTTNLIREELEKNGIEIQEGIATPGIVGIIRGKNEGKTIALRADLDALPLNEKSGLDFSSKIENVAHCCGHDIHTSVLLGVGIILNRKKDILNGNVKLIFQPSEEKLAGSKKMLKEGALNNPDVDAIITAHCWPEIDAGKVGIRRGPIMAAADEVDIRIKGTSGHAAHPHKSVDPLPIAGQIITALQTIVSRETSPLEQMVITFGTINGGIARNIISDEVFLQGTVRNLSIEGQKNVSFKIRRIVEGIAKSMNGEGIVDYRFGPPPVVNDESIMDIIESSLNKSIGSDSIEYLENPSMGSEDFAYYLQQVPGALIRLGTGSDLESSRLPLHNPGIIFDEGSIPAGVKAISNIAIDYLNNNN